MEVFNLENWINFDNLPKRKDGKIDWKNCNHNLVNFCYRGNVDCLIIEKRIDVDTLSILFNNNIFNLEIQSLKKCCLGKLYDFAVVNNYHYKIGDIIDDNKRKIKVLDTIRIKMGDKTTKGYLVECLKCGNVYEITEGNLLRGDGCNVCSNHQVQVGINDLWTTRRDIAEMLKYPEDGHKYMQYSNVLVYFRCKKCKHDIGQSYIHNVSRFGLSCPFCGSGISYPNRLMTNLLEYLGEDFDTEVVYNWCKFPSYNDSGKISTGRYDFVIESKKIIIEMDGGFGHGNDPHPLSRYSKEELIYRDKMKDKLAIDNGYKIIRIDCNYKMENRLEYCSKNIIDSALADIYQLSDVEWDYINQNAS